MNCTWPTCGCPERDRCKPMIKIEDRQDSEAERAHHAMTAGCLRTDLEHMTRERDEALARIDAGIKAEREACAEIALAIDSGRGNEKEIAAAIQARSK